MINDVLSQAVVRLYNQERFYAELVISMDKIINKGIPTAGVCIKNNIQLHVNPDFFAALTPNEQVAVLKHECEHIFRDHISRMKTLAPEVYGKSKDIVEDIINSTKHRVLNVAADCAINCSLQNLPEGGCYPETFNLENGETFEFYANALKDNEEMKKMLGKGGAEGDGIDMHELWGDSEGGEEELKEKIKQAVNKAAQKTRAAGKMSSDNELLVERLNYKPRDWRADLKRFAARALETALETSKKKRNRRYGIMYPGVIKQETLHIGVAIDTSGSVSDEALCQFMAEIGNIAKYATVTVVEADSEVKDAYVFDPKKTYKVKGRGGTAYQPAFEYFNKETDVDGVIYFGDMDSSDTPDKPKYPVMWAVIGGQRPPVEWGSATKVEVSRK